MAKSAFEKWYSKHGIAFNLNNVAAELAWLAALRWALRQHKSGHNVFGETIHDKSYDKIEAEIKRIKGS